MKIDSHHHFWHYDPLEYSWIDDTMSIIRRDFLPADLQSTIQAAGIEGVVSVQARQSLEETRWLLELAGAHDFIKGVIGWVPLLDENVRESLEEFASNAKFKGVRHILQGEEPEFMLRADFNRGVATLREFDVVYDVLIYERHLPRAIEFVDRHPEQRFVVDHIAKPRIGENSLEPWRSQIRELARRHHVWCKLSGMVTEADFRNWTPQQLQPYVETVIEAFGAHRVLFGSDWPVCLVACDYTRWCETVAQFIEQLSLEEKARIWGQNAMDVYRLSEK